MTKKQPPKPTVMERAQEVFEKAGISLEELGRRMNYEEGTARRAAWQFLRKTTDPRLSMLQRFADAMNVPLADLVK